MNKLKTYMLLGFVSALMLCMTFCCYKATTLIMEIALNPNGVHREVAITFSFIWVGISVICTWLSYAIITDQWESL